MADLNPTGSFETKRPGFVQVSATDKEVAFGTYMYKNTMGEITSLSHARVADEIDVTGGMSQLIAKIYANHRYELNVTILVMGEDPYPGPGDEVEFPALNLRGRVGGNVTKNADPGNAHTVTFTITSWDSLDNAGAGKATVVDPSATPNP